MGRVARAESHKTRDRARTVRTSWTSLLLVALFCLCASVPALSQSGRRQEPGSKGGKPTPRPIDPNRPGASIPTKAGDEIDPDDVVKISSNLVPIPVSA